MQIASEPGFVCKPTFLKRLLAYKMNIKLALPMLKLANGRNDILLITELLFAFLNQSTGLIDWQPPVVRIGQVELLDFIGLDQIFLPSPFHLVLLIVPSDLNNHCMVGQQTVPQNGLLQSQ